MLPFFVLSRPNQNNLPQTNSNLLLPYRFVQPKYKQYSPPSDNIEKIKEKPIETNKMKWGEPTWFLFHTLAQKVKEENFSQIRAELLNKIISICNNLPCPNCSKHATDYMNSINFSTILTKKDLIDLLFNFHNTVNEKKNYPEFPYSELEEKYSKAITTNIIQYFMKFFQDKQYNVSMLSNNMHRERLMRTLLIWFNENIKFFDP